MCEVSELRPATEFSEHDAGQLRGGDGAGLTGRREELHGNVALASRPGSNAFPQLLCCAAPQWLNQFSTVCTVSGQSGQWNPPPKVLTTQNTDRCGSQADVELSGSPQMMQILLCSRLLNGLLERAGPIHRTMLAPETRWPCKTTSNPREPGCMSAILRHIPMPMRRRP